MGDISRREFFKRGLAVGAATAGILSGLNGKAYAAGDTPVMATMIDLSKCNGCGECITACQIKNGFPVDKNPNELSPENLIYLQEVTVQHNGKNNTVYIPRRCMHCDNPPCANLCPFGVHTKEPEGPVIIDRDHCLGGRKCEKVCPWHFPKQKKGIGFYKKLQPLPMGAGVMFKCDMCYDLVREGKTPKCIEACPQKAMVFGEKEEIRKLTHKRAKELGGFIYGEKENGGTSTFYVSPVPFTKINKALKEKEIKPGMKPEIENFLDTANGLFQSMLIAPVAGVFTAGLMAYKTMKGEK